MIEVIHKAIRKLEERIDECKSSLNADDKYIMGLEHAVRFMKTELQDALNAKGVQDE